MSYFCAACNAALELDSPSSIGRRDCCPYCGADLHSCRNCQHYSVSAYNECIETQADRVLEKERSNFCEYFRFADNKEARNAQTKSSQEAFKKLDKLFNG